MMANPRSQTTRVKRKRKKSQVPAAMALLVILIDLVAGGVAIGYMRTRIDQITVTHKRNLAELAKETENAKAELDAQRSALTKQIRELQAQNVRLERESARLTKIRAALEDELKGIQQQNARLERQTERAELDKSLVGEGLGELKKKADHLFAQRQDLLNEFQARYVALKTELRRLVDGEKPDRVRSFFRAHNQTPLGPAAAFFAGDQYYAKRQTRSAQEMYEKIIKGYPDSKYADIAQERLGDIKRRLPYNPYYSAGFYPHNVPAVLDFGKWESD